MFDASQTLLDDNTDGQTGNGSWRPNLPFKRKKK